MEQQCSAATEVADKKLEAAEERREKHSGSADTAADPEDVRMAKESGLSHRRHDFIIVITDFFSKIFNIF